MILLMVVRRYTQILRIHGKFNPSLISSAEFSTEAYSFPDTVSQVEKITQIINNHPFPDQPLQPVLLHHIPASNLSTYLIESVLGRLFAAHSNGLKALEFFKFCLQHCKFCPSIDSFEKTLHILVRMRYFDKAWEIIDEMGRTNPSLLTLKSISILLSKIAKFQSYEDTLEAFEKMETDIFRKKFGVDEFNVLLRAFSTQRQMKEARSVFGKMHSRFSPNTKTMNILLLGFKESGDLTSVELFYHELVRRGFKPNSVTYNIRIDAYCKNGSLGDGLRLLEEMEKESCSLGLETITTLIHGAGIARNIRKARELFDEIGLRKLPCDAKAYNALMSSFIRNKDVNSAYALMHEMEGKKVKYDSMTYHTMFFGFIRSGGIEKVSELFRKMIEKKFVPKTRTMVMLMKYFCQNRRVDLGLNLWDYVVEKGYCPHGHALDLMVTGLCSHGMVVEAFECCEQMLKRGRHMSQPTYLMMERFLKQVGEMEKLRDLDQMRKKLQTILPAYRENAIIDSS